MFFLDFSLKIFNICLLGRDFHTFIKNVSFFSSTDVRSHNPPPSGPSVLVGIRSSLQLTWDLIIGWGEERNILYKCMKTLKGKPKENNILFSSCLHVGLVHETAEKAGVLTHTLYENQHQNRHDHIDSNFIIAFLLT